MKKIKLNLKELNVASFETTKMKEEKGTVFANSMANCTGDEGCPIDWTALGKCYCTEGGQSECPNTLVCDDPTV